MALTINPATVLERQQRSSIQGLAREYSAKAALRTMYEQRAAKLGMTLAGYCQRFNIRGV
ncbi:gp [Shigella phage Buco]|uniref:Uncharacterized protein n=1 Tax=Shigella phage Buco TaxID=2530183 RepID=A0A482JKS1_9CAUD|nr:gp [Shigella phage Buco]QBP32907.1 hypothetical protein HRP29_gp7 [Shigella phage Buco]